MSATDVALVVASVLAFALGAVHSALGEARVFRPSGGATGRDPLRRHIGILRASWHAVTLFGWALAALLLRSGIERSPLERAFLEVALVPAFLGASALVAVLTRGRPPGGWVLLVIGALVWWAL